MGEAPALLLSKQEYTGTPKWLQVPGGHLSSRRSTHAISQGTHYTAGSEVKTCERWQPINVQFKCTSNPRMSPYHHRHKYTQM